MLPKPPRTASNYRMYPADAVRRIRFIKRAQRLGFSLEEIKELLSLRGLPAPKPRTSKRESQGWHWPNLARDKNLLTL
jgi:DNA-binding transcriptional MerR regulator